MSETENISSFGEALCLTCLTPLNKCDQTAVKCSSVLSAPDRVALVNKVMTACSIKLFSDGHEERKVHQQICPTCVHQLEAMVVFIEQCMRAQETMQHHLWASVPEVSIKDEAEIKQESDSGNFEDDLPAGIFTTASAVLNQLRQDDSSDADDADNMPLSLMKTELTMRKNLRKARMFKCSECGKMFQNSVTLLKHQTTHSGPHACHICGEKYLSSSKLQIHYRVKHGRLKRSEFACRFCGEKYQNIRLLTKHKEEKHMDKLSEVEEHCKMYDSHEAFSENKEVVVVRNYDCSSCSKSFKNPKSLRNHIASVHVGMKRFVCHCGHSFHRRERLQYHVDYVHDKKDDRNYQCNECSKKFRNMEALRVHRKVHSDVKPFPCEVCGRTFRLRSQMQSHFVRLHSSDKSSLRTHLCDNCGKSFDCKANLQNHILRQHTLNPERNVECPICQKKYLDKKSVRRHMRMHNDSKPFLCTQCARWFKTGPLLQDHINRIHLELRPFECATCGSKFKMNKDLAKHLRTHTGERPFPCPYCSYTCAVKSNLQKHVANIHLKAK